jgi:hypothetical protein
MKFFIASPWGNAEALKHLTGALEDYPNVEAFLRSLPTSGF